jgi:MoaA/NifB/PqqE/SkfB family radical SAM enzyme
MKLRINVMNTNVCETSGDIKFSIKTNGVASNSEIMDKIRKCIILFG